MKTVIRNKKAAQPVGPYNQAIRIDNFIFTAGQIALNQEGIIVGTEIQTQTKQVLENIKLILEEAGSSLDKIVKTTVFLTDMKEYSKMNDIYATYFTKEYPARSTVEVSNLPKNAIVEIEAIAAIE